MQYRHLFITWRFPLYPNKVTETRHVTPPSKKCDQTLGVWKLETFYKEAINFNHPFFIATHYRLKVCFITPWPFRLKGYLSLPAPVRLSTRLSVRPSVRKLYLVRTISRHRFELGSPNLHQTCIVRYSWILSKIGVIDPELPGHFGHFDPEFYEIRLARAITFNEFELELPNLQLVILAAGIENERH